MIVTVSQSRSSASQISSKGCFAVQNHWPCIQYSKSSSQAVEHACTRSSSVKPSQSLSILSQTSTGTGPHNPQLFNCPSSISPSQSLSIPSQISSVQLTIHSVYCIKPLTHTLSCMPGSPSPFKHGASFSIRYCVGLHSSCCSHSPWKTIVFGSSHSLTQICFRQTSLKSSQKYQSHFTHGSCHIEYVSSSTTISTTPSDRDWETNLC